MRHQMSEETAVGGGSVVLLAAVLVLVVLVLGGWLLLRRRGTSGAGAPGEDDSERRSTAHHSAPASAGTAPPAGTAPMAGTASPAGTAPMAGAAAAGWTATGQPRDETAPGAAEQADPALGDASVSAESGGSVESGSSVDDPVEMSQGEPPAEGAESAEDGLDVVRSAESDGDEELSGSAPRTPTEAFGEADGVRQMASTEGTSHGSLLDDLGSDSTPLFRSIREQMMATAETAEDVVHDDEGVPARREATSPRRISELHEVVDGGYGIGSAAFISDGAQPLGHPIKGDVQSRTYQDLHSPEYDQGEPDVWFLDVGFAERAGFRRAD